MSLAFAATQSLSVFCMVSSLMSTLGSMLALQLCSVKMTPIIVWLRTEIPELPACYRIMPTKEKLLWLLKFGAIRNLKCTYIVHPDAPEISAANWRVSNMVQNSENCLYKHRYGDASVKKQSHRKVSPATERQWDVRRKLTHVRGIFEGNLS